MLNRREIIDLCLSLPSCFEDYPFEDPNWALVRHSANQKTFAFIFEREGKTWINVKAEPLKADFWRDAYSAVTYAYHMNKRHWISIILDGSMSDEDIFMLVKDSYELTRPKLKIKKE